MLTVTTKMMMMTTMTMMMMMMTLIMSTMVTHNCATSSDSDTSQTSDVKRSPWFYQHPPQLTFDTPVHLVPGSDHFQV